MEPKGPEGQEFQVHRSNILAVEDSASLAKLQELVFNGIHPSARLVDRYAVFTEPEKALEEFRQNSGEYDAIVTDFNMPGMNGAELIAEARKINPDIASILLSSNTREDLGEVANNFDLLLDKRKFSIDQAPDIAKQIKQAIVSRAEQK